MSSHNVSIRPEDGKYIVTCSGGDLNKKYDSRNIAYLAARLHTVRIGFEQLELAEAGKEDHD